MMRRTSAIVFAAGLLFGAAGVWFGGRASVAHAQPQPAGGVVGRYQISAYAYPGSTRSPHDAGAYVLDTQTGEVFVVAGGRAPQPVGAVGRAK